MAVRCRLRRDAIVIEFDAVALKSIAERDRAEITGIVREHFADTAADLPVRIDRYRRGSAFIGASARHSNVAGSS